MLGAVPRQIKACAKNNISPIFAAELYINPLQPESSCLEDMQKFTKDLDDEQKLALRPSPHLLAIAYNEIGYSNLVRLTSWGWTKGFYRKPRINYEQLIKHKEGLFFTSCCYNSEVGRAFEHGGEDAAFAMIEKYVEMVGKDHYFLELMMLDFAKQKPYDKFIVKAHEKYGLPLILSQDVHYCNKEDSKYQRLMLMVQTGRTIQDIQKAMAEDNMQDFFELQDTQLFLKSESELNEMWFNEYQDIIPYELFCQAKMNTVKICERAKGVQLDRSLKLPVIPDADDILLEEIKKGVKERRIPKTAEYSKRIQEEYSLITRKGFASYFLIQKKMTDEARRVCGELLGFGDGSQACGPGRGCLAPDVLIQLRNGFCKKIKDIIVGDEVITRFAANKVLTVFKYDCTEDLLRIKCENDDVGVSLTSDHKIWVKNKEWIPASEVCVGDLVLKHNNFYVKIKSIELEKNPSGVVYDLEVEDNHEYFTKSFLVHNSAAGALICYLLQITSVDPVYEGLLFSRFMSEARGGRSIVLEFKNIDPISAEETFKD